MHYLPPPPWERYTSCNRTVVGSIPPRLVQEHVFVSISSISPPPLPVPSAGLLDGNFHLFFFRHVATSFSLALFAALIRDLDIQRAQFLLGIQGQRVNDLGTAVEGSHEPSFTMNSILLDSSSHHQPSSTNIHTHTFVAAVIAAGSSTSLNKLPLLPSCILREKKS